MVFPSELSINTCSNLIFIREIVNRDNKKIQAGSSHKSLNSFQSKSSRDVDSTSFIYYCILRFTRGCFLKIPFYIIKADSTF